MAVLAGRLAQPLGRAAGGRGQHGPGAGRLGQADDAAHGRRLAGARPAGQHGDAMGQRGLDRLHLPRGQSDAASGSGAAQTPRPIEVLERAQPVFGCLGQAAQAVGDAHLAVVERDKIDGAIFGQQRGRCGRA